METPGNRRPVIIRRSLRRLWRVLPSWLKSAYIALVRLPAVFPPTRAVLRATRRRFVRRMTTDGTARTRLVVSGGGVATTTLMEHLGQYITINDPRDRDGLKHLPAPPAVPNGDGKALFVYGDPIAAVQSLYRRGFAHRQSIKLGSRVLRFPSSIAEYAERGEDLLGLTQQFMSWLRSESREFPVMFVRYETLWDHLEDVADFLGLPPATMRGFPPRRERASHGTDIDTEIISKLRRVYAPLLDQMGQLGEIAIS